MERTGEKGRSSRSGEIRPPTSSLAKDQYELGTRPDVGYADFALFRCSRSNVGFAVTAIRPLSSQHSKIRLGERQINYLDQSGTALAVFQL